MDNPILPSAEDLARLITKALYSHPDATEIDFKRDIAFGQKGRAIVVYIAHVVHDDLQRRIQEYVDAHQE